MKAKALAAASVVVTVVASMFTSTACSLIVYQPKVPKSMK